MNRLLLYAYLIICFTGTYHVSSQNLPLVLRVDWSPDGDYIVTGDNAGGVDVWYAASGEHITTLKGHTQEIMALKWSPDGQWIASGSPDGTLRIWSTALNQIAHEIRFTDAGSVLRAISAIAWSPNSLLIAGARETGQVIIWDALTGNRLGEYAHGFGALTVDWDPSGKKLISGGLDGKIYEWDRFTYQVRDYDPEALSGFLAVNSIGWSPVGDKIAVVGSQTGGRYSVRVYDVHMRSLLFEHHLSPESFASVYWSPDGRRLAVMDRGTLILIDQDGSGVEATETGEITRSMSWSPYGARIAVRNNKDIRSISDVSRGFITLVPAPSLDRLNAIAALCVRDGNAGLSSVQALTQPAASLADLPAYIARVEALPADAIPPACRADLLAVAGALLAGE